MNPSRETKFSGTHGDRGIFIFPAQLTTSRIGNLIRLIYSAICDDHTYIHTCILKHSDSINEESHGLKNVPRTCIVYLVNFNNFLTDTSSDAIATWGLNRIGVIFSSTECSALVFTVFSR